VYYHASSDADAARSFPLGGRVAAGLDARADFVFVSPGYIAATPVAGGQAAFGVAGVFGALNVDTTATLQGPRGNVFSTGLSDERQGFGDLYPTASLRWSSGHHNGMVYTMGGVPVGAYDADRLANLGTNHWSLDGGGGYTYLDPANGREFSAVLGFTYNWENPDTDYQNGVDAHLDWAASQFLSESTHVGVVGYLYQQVTGDSGAGAVLGDFKSQVAGIGPQVGHFFAFGGKKAYFNLKGIYEFDAENRPSGWNTWVTVSIPLQ
jgi:hypothetical protein